MTVADLIETVAKSVPGVSSAIAERPTSGRYVDVAIRRDAAARYGLTQERVQQMIATVVGGDPIGQTVEGRERYPIVVRSEEHTSELQSLMRISYAVFCLTKKNTQHLPTKNK